MEIPIRRFLAVGGDFFCSGEQREVPYSKTWEIFSNLCLAEVFNRVSFESPMSQFQSLRLVFNNRTPKAEGV